MPTPLNFGNMSCRLAAVCEELGDVALSEDYQVPETRTVEAPICICVYTACIDI